MGTAKSPTPVATPSNHNVDIDEKVWQAWLEKNRERDRIRFARRVRLTKYIIPLLVLSALIWNYLG